MSEKYNLVRNILLAPTDCLRNTNLVRNVLLAPTDCLRNTNLVTNILLAPTDFLRNTNLVRNMLLAPTDWLISARLEVESKKQKFKRVSFEDETGGSCKVGTIAQRKE